MGADLKPGSPFWLASKEASHFFAKPPRGLSSDGFTDLKRVAILRIPSTRFSLWFSGDML